MYLQLQSGKRKAASIHQVTQTRILTEGVFFVETAVRETESSVSTSSCTDTNAYWRYLLEIAVSKTKSSVNT